MLYIHTIRRGISRQEWLDRIFWRFCILQQGLAFLIPILYVTESKLLYRLIPHPEGMHTWAASSDVQTKGMTPEQAAPFAMGIALFFCNVFAALTLLICFFQISSLKCCCPGAVNPVSYFLTNLLQLVLWVWASGEVGGVMWTWESYMGIDLLTEPIWWAAFAVQVVVAGAFLIPALASIAVAFQPWRAELVDEERRPLIVVVERRRDGREGQVDEAPPSYGT